MRFYYRTEAGDRVLETTPDQVTTALAEIQQQLLAQGQVAVGVYVDGTLVTAEPDAITDYIRSAGRPVTELHVEVRSLKDVARDTTQSAGEYLDRLVERVPALVDELYAGLASTEQLADLFEGLQWLTDFLHLALPQVIGDGERLADMERRFSGALLRLADLDGDFDAAFLADLLAYEIVPVLDELRQLVHGALQGDGS